MPGQCRTNQLRVSPAGAVEVKVLDPCLLLDRRFGIGKQVAVFSRQVGFGNDADGTLRRISIDREWKAGWSESGRNRSDMTARRLLDSDRRRRLFPLFRRGSLTAL